MSGGNDKIKKELYKTALTDIYLLKKDIDANRFRVRNLQKAIWSDDAVILSQMLSEITTAKKSINWGDILNKPTSMPPNGAAGGDLAGTYPDPTIGFFQTLPVLLSVPVLNDVITWDGAKWISQAGGGGGTVTSVAALTLGTTGTDLSSTVANGTTTPVITLQVPTASASNRGALSSADWTTFNNKGSGTVTSVGATSPITSSGGATPTISTSITTNKLIGRGTVGTGVMEEITLGTNLSLTGTTLNASGGGGGLPIATAAGAVDVITATYSPALTLSDKVVCAFVATGANTTTTPTFNADGLGAKTIVKQGGQALVAGDIPNALTVCILEYNLANTRWELLNPAYGKTATNILKANFGATWDGQGAVIGTGAWQEIIVPYAGTITDWVIDSYTPATGVVVSGSIIIELYRSGASIIGAGNKPTLSSASTNSAAVAGWTSTAVAAGDKLYAYVSSSPVSCLKVTCTFNITKT